MEVAIEYSSRFKRRYRRLTIVLQKKVDARLGLFIAEPLHPLLDNHPLAGSLNSMRSINITGDYRIWYTATDGVIRLVRLGTHAELYKK